jgi:holo-[acyl-carrier protein] synthase
MVLGIGIDIIEIERIKKSIDQFGDRFLNKIYTQVELEYSLAKPSKYQHLAARFAAKEAVAKALSSVKENGFNWKDIEIYNKDNGMPVVKLYGDLERIVKDGKELKISMSHSDNYVTCFAILQE